MFDRNELNKRFNHHSPKDPAVGDALTRVRAICLEAVEAIGKLMPPNAGREGSLVLTNMEQVMFWANAGIARNQ